MTIQAPRPQVFYDWLYLAEYMLDSNKWNEQDVQALNKVFLEEEPFEGALMCIPCPSLCSGYSDTVVRERYGFANTADMVGVCTSAYLALGLNPVSANLMVEWRSGN